MNRNLVSGQIDSSLFVIASLKSLGIRGVSLLAGFMMSVLMARSLGVADFGAVAVALSFSSVVGLAATAGFGGLAVREVAKLANAGSEKRLTHFLCYSSCVVILTASAFTVSLGMYANSDWVQDRYSEELAISSIMILPVAILWYSRGIHQGLGNITMALVPMDILRPILIVMGVSFALFFSISVSSVYFLVFYFVVLIIAAMISIFPLLVNFTFVSRGSVTPCNAKEWNSAVSPFLILSLLTVISAEISTIMLGLLSDPKQAGLFQPVARLASVIIIGFQATNLLYAPRISSLWKDKNLEEIKRLTRLATLVTSILTLLVGAALAAGAPLALSIFGASFKEAKDALIIVAFAQIFNGLCGPGGMLLLMTRYQTAVIWIRLAGLLVNVALGCLLIVDFGATGAAIAFAAGTVAWNLVMVWLVNKYFSFDCTIISYLWVKLVRRE